MKKKPNLSLLKNATDLRAYYQQNNTQNATKCHFSVASSFDFSMAGNCNFNC